MDISEVVCEVSWYCWHFGQIILCCGTVLCIGRCLAAPLASTHQKQQQEVANILKISKPIKLLVKMKNVSFILWKKRNGLSGQLNVFTHTHTLFSFLTQKKHFGASSLSFHSEFQRSFHVIVQKFVQYSMYRIATIYNQSLADQKMCCFQYFDVIEQCYNQ